MKLTSYHTIQIDAQNGDIYRTKVAPNNATSGRIYVPVDWVGKRVYVVIPK